MTDDQADELLKNNDWAKWADARDLLMEAAHMGAMNARKTLDAELRRLSAVEAQRDALLKMLKDVLPVAEDASESLGRFCGDEGWAQEDMDRMDNVDGMLPLIRAAIEAVEDGK